MINLMPDHVRANNRYAYKNLRLLRYTLISALTMATIALLTGLSILSMMHTKSNLQEQIAQQDQKIAAYKPLEKQGESLSNQLKTINTLLDHQVTYSTLLPYMSKVLPPGAILTQLDFSTTDVTPATISKTTASAASKKPFIILAAVKDRSVATTLLENIRSSKDLFADADLVDINQQAGDTSPYPFQVSINAYFQKDALLKLSNGTAAVSPNTGSSR